MFYHFSQDLPKLDSLRDYNPPTVSEVYGADGTKVGEFWLEKRYVLKSNEIPRVIINAIVASEDDRFFDHHGIDYLGIIRAFVKNLQAGHTVEGASTITQQVARSFFLSQEKTYRRKIKEAIVATKIEKNLSKDEILYLYLNQMFFGNRAYGVEAAARNYFHKTAKELSIAEASMIAGLAQSPVGKSPITNFKAAKERQEYVIRRMFEVGSITKEQMSKAITENLTIYAEGIDKDFNLRYTPWYTEYVRRFIQEKYGEQFPYTTGLRIETAVIPSMQKAADRAVERGLRELDKRQGYKAPLKKLTSEEIPAFIEASHMTLIKQEVFKDGLVVRISKEELTEKPTPIKPGEYYQAVIIEVNRKAQELGIQVGHIKGIIKVQDYGWARKRNTQGAGYDGAIYVRDPGGTFNVGDVIWVKLKNIDTAKATTPTIAGAPLLFTLEQEPVVESALFSYEPQSGMVRAVVGGRDFKKSEYNRAMQAIRQTGSSIKPLIYAAALDKGYTPSTTIEDSPLYYETSPGRFWTPKNYGGGYSGPTSFRNALVNSRNVPTVRILMDIGLDFTTAYARKLGITTPIKRYYSMALGSNDMKLYELSRAYGTFVTGGILPDLVFITKMTDRFGRVLEEHIPRKIVTFTEQLQKMQNEKRTDFKLKPELYDAGKKIIEAEGLKLTDGEQKILYGDYIPEGYTISPRTAYTMIQLMNDVVNFGTGYLVKRDLKRPAAGKTGTTNDETDVWFVGFVPDLFAGVWVGFDQVQKIGARETGGHTAAPIFVYYMQEVLKDKPVAEFTIPKEINQAALDAPVDDSVGDAEAGGLGPETSTSGSKSGADFFINDF